MCWYPPFIASNTCSTPHTQCEDSKVRAPLADTWYRRRIKAKFAQRFGFLHGVIFFFKPAQTFFRVLNSFPLQIATLRQSVWGNWCCHHHGKLNSYSHLLHVQKNKYESPQNYSDDVLFARNVLNRFLIESVKTIRWAFVEHSTERNDFVGAILWKMERMLIILIFIITIMIFLFLLLC